MQKILLLISGLAGSGKSTIANYIMQKFDIKKYSLGDVLKETLVEVSNLFNDPITLSDLYNTKKKQQYRHHMQIFGTDILRKYFGDDIFNVALEKRVDNSKSFIIDDVRFKNEYDYWVNYAKTYNYKLITLRVIRKQNSLKENEKIHISEQLLGVGFMELIDNEGSKDELYKQIDEIILNYEIISY